MKQWFYSESNEQRGPISEAELQQLLESRVLTPATLVWSEGMRQWSPAGSLTIFAPSPYASPGANPNEQIDWSGYTPSGSQVRPWIRYWARTVDFLIFSLLTGFVIALVHPEFLEMSDALVGMVLLVFYNLYEPVLLSLIGTTPMKALLNVRVRNREGNKLTFPEALVRMLKVWLRGLGLGIPLISLFTHITAYNRLKNQGITSWDQDGGFVISHRDVPWWRWLVLISIIVGFVGLIVLGSEA